MLGERSRPTIPVAKPWPSQVRSSLLYAISLAHFTLIFTRSWAANSLNARIRLKQDNDRLRQGLTLLREEMRIKNSRMLRIPAQRRPHCPAAERLAILELRAARGWSRTQTARHLLVTTATVCSWMGRLEEEGPSTPTRDVAPFFCQPERGRFETVRAGSPSVKQTETSRGIESRAFSERLSPLPGQDSHLLD